MKKIYILEDDENIRELVSYALKGGGFQAFSFEKGNDFFQALEKEIPDLLLLDIMLPGEDGLSILKKLKQVSRWKGFPVILLTAKGSEFDKIKGLDAGADDYVTKPFSVMELLSRIQAVLRRTGKEEVKKLVYDDIQMDDDKHLVLVGEEIIHLTLKEYELLSYFLYNPGIVLSREKIIETIWGYDFPGETRTVDMHIKSLRQKLGASGEKIKTIRGIGYKLL